MIQNNDRLVVVSLAKRLNQAYKPVEIEAIVAIQAIEFAGEIGVDRISVEGDSSVVMKALRTKNIGMVYGLLIDDARVLEMNFA